MTTSTIYPLTIYYESACALCNSEMTNLRLRNTADLLRFVDVSDPAFRDPPPGTTPADLLALIHAQRADGGVIRGVEVFRLAYTAVGLGWVRRVLDLPLLGRLAERSYPWLARHRHQIPRWVSHLLFETGVRRAAESAAAQRCAAGDSCRL
jgi:predicted DCC family thiol-disulfide oxidoreductase YuxK